MEKPQAKINALAIILEGVASCEDCSFHYVGKIGKITEQFVEIWSGSLDTHMVV